MIRAQRLFKAYGGRELWNGLSFNVEPASMLAIVGHSGAGKTTLLICVGGLDQPDKGSLDVKGVEPGALRGSARKRFFRETVSFLFQNSGLVDEWSVSRNLDLALEPLRLKARDKQREKVDAITRVGLGHALKEPVHQLSGGERQRVALARLMLKRGDVILADEPSSALDDDNCSILCDVLLERRNTGASILVSTHDPRVIERCDGVLSLSDLDVLQEEERILVERV